MKKHNLIYILLLAPIVLLAQTDQSALDGIDLSDVVVIEDTPAPGVEASPAPVDGPVVVEIPDAPIDGAMIDDEAPDIPDVTVALPGETEVVLELPGQETSPGEATMAEEETISVDFPDEDIRTILRNVADLFDLNLVIPDTLQGRTSVKLRNITWRQVFEVVLEPLGFTYVEDRNIIRIKSIEELTTEPVDTRVFVANYARAEDLQGSLAPLVDAAAGGRIEVDVRSNALVITERPSRMNKIQEIIERLDKATDQVMIESKFIEIQNTDIKNIGVDWTSLSGYGVSVGGDDENPLGRRWTRTRGKSDTSSGDTGTTGSSTTTTSSGSDDGSSRPEVVDTSEDVGSTLDALSKVASTASTGRMDTALFSADQFAVVLSALKQQDDIKLVSNPTVVTLDNTEAKIAIGRRYPIPSYSFNSETGQRQLDDIEYEDIGINLDVTPQVNSAGFINLKILPEVSSSDRFALIEGTQIPIIESRRTETTIMIKDGFTLAIGGLAENTVADRGSHVPVLGDLPYLGRLFSSESDEISQRNLIIFITAKTLNPDGSTYHDVIDPRVLNDMGIVPSDVPGYQLPQEDQATFKQLEEIRAERRRTEDMTETLSQLEQFENAKLQEQKQIEYAEMQKEEKRKSNRRTK
jgi:type IV pilus assembly protein PilQ